MNLFSWDDTLLPSPKVIVCSILWLGPLFLAWAGLIILSHQTTEWAIMWTQRLFGWMLLMTYVFLWGWMIGVSRRPRLILFRGILWTITLSGLIFCLELSATLKLVHWGLVLNRYLVNCKTAFGRISETGSWSSGEDPTIGGKVI